MIRLQKSHQRRFISFKLSLLLVRMSLSLNPQNVWKFSSFH